MPYGGPRLYRFYNYEQIDYIEAPTGGWNPDANPWELPSNQASVLDNFLIRPGKIVCRGGFTATNDLSALKSPMALCGYIKATAGSPTLILTSKAISQTSFVDPWWAPIVRPASPGLIASPSLTATAVVPGQSATAITVASGNFLPGPRSVNFSGIVYGISYGSFSGPVLSNDQYYAQSTSLVTAIPSTSSQAGAGAVVSDASGGLIVWSNPGNAVGQNPSTSAQAVLGASNSSRNLKATTYGFAIPAGSIINGIEVQIMQSSDAAGNVFDNSVKIVKGGAIVGTDQSRNWQTWPSVQAFRTYGSPTDLWGTTWTPTDINSSGFGAAVSCFNIDAFAGHTGSVYEIVITVYYSPVASLTPLENAPHGALDLKGYLSRIWLLGGIDTPGGGTTFSPNALFFTNPGVSTNAVQLGSASADWKDPVSGLVNKIVMDNDSRDPGMGLALVRNGMLILRYGSIWLLRGTTTSSFTLQPVSRDTGCVDARSIVETTRGVYFLSRQGLMFTDGVNVQNVSGAVTHTLQLAIQTFTQSVLGAYGGHAICAATSRGQIVVSIGLQQASRGRIGNPASYTGSIFPIWCAMLDPLTGAWTRITSQVWTADATQQGDPSNLYPGWVIQVPPSANGFMFAVGDKYVTVMEDLLGVTGPQFSFVTGSNLYDSLPGSSFSQPYQSIPAVWKTRYVPIVGTQTRRFGQAKRYFIDYAFGAHALVPTTGWAVRPVNVFDNNDVFNFETLNVPLGSEPVANGSVSGVQLTGTPRLQHQHHDFTYEIQDLGFDVSWVDVALESAQPTNVVAEIYGVGVEFQRTRDAR